MYGVVTNRGSDSQTTSIFFELDICNSTLHITYDDSARLRPVGKKKHVIVNRLHYVSVNPKG